MKKKFSSLSCIVKTVWYFSRAHCNSQWALVWSDCDLA
jgi:hypothetical protein